MEVWSFEADMEARLWAAEISGSVLLPLAGYFSTSLRISARILRSVSIGSSLDRNLGIFGVRTVPELAADLVCVDSSLDRTSAHKVHFCRRIVQRVRWEGSCGGTA